MMKDMSMYTQENATTIRTARDSYEARCQKRADKNQSAEALRISRLLKKAAPSLSKKGSFLVTPRDLKKLQKTSCDPLRFIYVETINKSDDEVQQSKNYYDEHHGHYGTLEKFIETAKASGLIVTHKWELDKNRKRWNAVGLFLRFK